MPTNNFVESSFWNFDSLFQPQQHPARDAHDTFFMAGQGCFVDNFHHNLGQKVFRILHFLTNSMPIPQICYHYVVQSRSGIIHPEFNIFVWGGGGAGAGRVFVVASAFKSFILKLDMATYP